VRALLDARLRKLRGGIEMGGGCAHDVVEIDEDGDEACARCGHYVALTGHVNGFDATAALMASNRGVA